MRKNSVLFFCSVGLSLVFFWQTLMKGLLPIPLDALVGLYHPFRDYFSSVNPQGVAYKNFLLTDPVLQQYPWKWLVMEDWKQGKIPRINPYNFSGTPLLANIQAGTFYPFNIIFLSGPFHWMWAIFIMLQPILAMVFMALWLREHKLGPLAQLFGGFVWAFSSFQVVWLEWGNVGHAGLWLPLALYGIEQGRGKKEEGRRHTKWISVVIFSWMMSLFAGHIQITFYLLCATALYWILRIGISRRSIFLFLLSIFFLLGITSIQWIPSLQLALASNRDVEQQNALAREGFFIEPKQLAQLVAPDFFGNPSTQNYRGSWNYAEQVIFIGVVPLVLVLFAVISSTQGRKVKLFVLILTGAGTLFSVKNPISVLPYKLKFPILSDFQPTRLSYITTFGLTVLGALGIQSFLEKPKRNIARFIIATAIIGGSLFALLVWSKHFDFSDRQVSQRNLVFSIALLFSFVLCYSAIWLFDVQRRTFLFPVACFLFTVLDLYRFGWKFTPFSPQKFLYPVTPAIQFLQSHMGPNDRFMTLDRKILPPNANIIYRLASINGYDPIYSKDYALQITRLESGRQETKPANFGRIIVPMNYHSPAILDLHVKFILSISELTDPILEKVYQEGETRVYELKKLD